MQLNSTQTIFIVKKKKGPPGLQKPVHINHHGIKTVSGYQGHSRARFYLVQNTIQIIFWIITFQWFSGWQDQPIYIKVQRTDSQHPSQEINTMSQPTRVE